jgi:hypothetical protein
MRRTESANGRYTVKKEGPSVQKESAAYINEKHFFIGLKIIAFAMQYTT